MVCFATQMARTSIDRTAPLLCERNREATMDKINNLLVDSSVVQIFPDTAFDSFSNSDVYIPDKRVASLLILLQQLDEAAAGLGALPEPELGEIVSSAIHLCGFADPIEARDVIAAVLDALKEDVISTVLDAIEVQDPMRNSP
jgi:hypothetical protein